jgi:hypothetical protein
VLSRLPKALQLDALRIYACISMGGAVVHHATIPENARQLFYQTWPGWMLGTYRAFDLPAEDAYLADLVPWSATFTGHLEEAEAIYNGSKGNLVGIRIRLGNTPQHGVLFGMTGAGKSVIIADLLAQIGHRSGFRLIVEEGLSHAVLTQTQGCQPVVVNPDGNLTISYLDLRSASRPALKLLRGELELPAFLWIRLEERARLLDMSRDQLVPAWLLEKLTREP